MRKMCVYNPHAGGRAIPPAVQERTRSRILAHAEKHYSGKYIRIDVRFRGRFCYVDAYTEPFVPADLDEKLWGETREEQIERLRNTPTHMCRLRYLGSADRWTMAFYTYSHEKYEPSFFQNGTFHGTPEEAFDTSAVYLMG